MRRRWVLEQFRDESGWSLCADQPTIWSGSSDHQRKNVGVLIRKKVALLNVLQILARAVVRVLSKQMYEPIHLCKRLCKIRDSKRPVTRECKVNSLSVFKTMYDNNIMIESRCIYVGQWSVEDELRSLAAWGVKLLCNLEVWQQRSCGSGTTRRCSGLLSRLLDPHTLHMLCNYLYQIFCQSSYLAISIGMEILLPSLILVWTSVYDANMVPTQSNEHCSRGT